MIMTIIKDLINFFFSCGLVANALLFLPQAYEIYKNKTAKGLSLYTFGGFNIIQIFTIAHGVIVGDFILASGFSLSFLTCAIVTLSILYFRFIQHGK